MTVAVLAKTCKDCGETKSLTEFHAAPNNQTDGRQARCKPCACAVAKADYAANRDERIAKVRAWRAENPEKARRYQYANKLKRFGLTLDDYDQMLAEQDGRCAICLTAEPGRGRRRFCVDHDHDTEAVRGLLCMNCNDGLGRFADDIELMERAAAYPRDAAIA